MGKKAFSRNKNERPKGSNAIDAGTLLRSLKDHPKDKQKPREVLDTLKIKPIIAVYGTGHCRPQSAINLILEQLPTSMVNRVHGAYLANEKALSEFRLLAHSEDLFSSSTAIILSDLNKARSQILPKLLEDLTKLNSHNIVLISQAELLTPSIQTQLQKISTSVLIPDLAPPQMQKWTQQEAKRKGLEELPKDALSLLLTDCNNDADEVIRILDKLALLILPGQKVTLEHVASLTAKRLEKTTFELFNCIARKDALGSSLFLKSIFSSGDHPLLIFGFLNKAFKTLYAQTIRKTHPEGEQSADLHTPWFYKQLSPQLFPVERISKALILLSELETHLKGNSVAAEDYFDWVVQRL